MLAVTEEAASAIDGILASPQMPDEAGMRVTAETVTEEGAPRTDLRLTVVEAPEANDQIVEDARIFLEPEAAALLDDKVLDADIAGEQVRFELKEQS
jgi:iron-sulfur cluster assembly protein